MTNKTKLTKWQIEAKQNIKDLKKLKESKDFKNLVIKLNNRADNIKNIILTDFKNWELNQNLEYSENDRILARWKVFNELADELWKIKLPWATLVEEVFDYLIKQQEETITTALTNTTWTWLSKKIYAKKEIDLTTAGEMSILEIRVDGMIWQDTKELEWESDRVYE